MYVIRDKKTNTVLDIVQSVPGETKDPKEVFPGFDPKVMEFGLSEVPGIPARFDIVNGIVKEVEEPDPEPAPPPAEVRSIEELKASALEAASKLSLERRQALVPDYQMLNAALGIYDEERTAAIRETARAFRDEYHRIEAEVKNAKSPRDLRAMTANFPTKLLLSTSTPSAASTLSPSGLLTPPSAPSIPTKPIIAKRGTHKPTDE